MAARYVAFGSIHMGGAIVNVAVRIAAPSLGGQGSWPGESEIVEEVEEEDEVVVELAADVVSAAAAAIVVVVGLGVVVGVVVVVVVVVGVVVGVVDVLCAPETCGAVATTSPVVAADVGADASVASWRLMVVSVDPTAPGIVEPPAISVESLGAPTTMVLLFDPITAVAIPAAAMIAPVANAVRMALRRGVARLASVWL
jgi:hypothetical protein